MFGPLKKNYFFAASLRPLGYRLVNMIWIRIVDPIPAFLIDGDPDPEPGLDESESRERKKGLDISM